MQRWPRPREAASRGSAPPGRGGRRRNRGASRRTRSGACPASRGSGTATVPPSSMAAMSACSSPCVTMASAWFRPARTGRSNTSDWAASTSDAFSFCSDRCIDGSHADAQDHPCRHGRLLCVGRAARQSRAAGPAGGGRSWRQAGGGCRRQLRGADLRHPLGDALDHGDAALPGARLRGAPLRPLSRHLAPDPGDLRRVHGAGRAAVAGRGLSRRVGKPPRPADRLGDRQGDPRAHSRGDRAHRLGRHLLQQVPRQAGIGRAQAERAVRHHAGDGAGLHRGAADRQVPRRRAGHGREDAAPRHRDRRRSARPAARLPAAAFRQIGRLVPRHRARARTTARWSPTGRGNPPAPRPPSRAT